MDGAHARPARGAGDVRRGRRVRLPRRPHLAGAALDAGARARVDLPDRPGAAPAAAALPLHNPRFVLGIRPPVPRPEARRAARRLPPLESVAVVGLGPGRPAARPLVRRPRRRRDRRRARGRRSSTSWRRATCRSRRPAPRSCSSGCCRAARFERTKVVQEAARADHIVLTLRHALLLAHRDRHLADPRRDRRPAAGPARGPLADPALDRRARHDRVGGRLHRAAPRLQGRRGRCSSRTCPSGSRRTTSSRRSRRCRASSAASARAPAPAPPSCSRCSAPRSSRRTPGAGRAGQDLDQHPALHAVRAAQPPDDGVRAVRRERVRRDRADQPRLPARRHRAAGADGRRLPAQGLHLLRGALERARACCWRCRACTRPCRCSSSRG